jgi:hypothetical protein
MGNEVKIKISVDNDTKAAVVDVKAGMHDVETAADKAGNKLSDLGRHINDVRGDLVKLDAAALASKGALSQLTSALANTDDAAQRLDIQKAISKVQRDLSSTAKAQKIKLGELINLDKDEASVKKMSQGLISSIGKSLSSGAEGISSLASSHIGITVGAAAGAAAAPVLISTIGSVLASGTGLGVIGVGIMAAVQKDQDIKSAGKAAGGRFMDALSTEATKAFKGPLLDSIQVLSDQGDKSAKKLGEAFNALAPSIKPFTQDLATAADTLTNSFTNSAKNSGPAIEGLGHSIVLLTDGVGTFIDQVSQGGPEAAQNLTLIAGALGDVIGQTGTFLGALSKLSSNEWLTGPLLPLLKKHYADTASATEDMTAQTADLNDAMADVVATSQMEGNELTNLANDMRAQTDPVFALIDAQDKLTDAQDAVKKATKDHGKESKEAQAALRDLAKAAIEVEGKSGELADSYGGEVTPALHATLLAAGLTEDQIKDLGKQFDTAKDKGDDFSKTYKAKIEADTATAANRIQHVKDLLADVRSKRISVSVLVADSQLNKVNNTLDRLGQNYAHGGIKGAASGMIGGDLTWVGENGPELLNLPPSTNVKSHPDSMRALSGAENDGTVNVNLVPATGTGYELVNAILTLLRVEVDRGGNGSVSKLLNRPGVTV